MIDRQIVVRRLRREIQEAQARYTELQYRTGEDLLRALAGMNHFQDRLVMEFKRAVTMRDTLSVMVITLTPSKDHADGAQHRNQDYQCAPRRGRGIDICVVVDDRMTGKEQVVDKADQISEKHGPEACDDAKAEREACYERQAAQLAARRKPETSATTSDTMGRRPDYFEMLAAIRSATELP